MTVEAADGTEIGSRHHLTFLFLAKYILNWIVNMRIWFVEAILFGGKKDVKSRKRVHKIIKLQKTLMSLDANKLRLCAPLQKSYSHTYICVETERRVLTQHSSKSHYVCWGVLHMQELHTFCLVIKQLQDGWKRAVRLLVSTDEALLRRRDRWRPYESFFFIRIS